MDFTLDFSKDIRNEIVFPNLTGVDISFFNFKYDLVPGEAARTVVDLSLWGLNDSGRTHLWYHKMFAETPNHNSFQVKFEDLNSFESFSLTAQRFDSGIKEFTSATLTVSTVPEPSSILLGMIALLILLILLDSKAKK